MTRLLSIVMPALAQRHSDSSMVRQLWQQIAPLGNEVEFFALMDNGPMSTGAKIQRLFGLCGGAFICLVADDDAVEPDYVSSILDVIKADPAVDAITFDHSYSVNGELTAITKQIPDCEEQQFVKEPGAACEIHHRLPGPLCPVRRDIASGFTHPDKSDGEDSAYKLHLRGKLKNVAHIDRVLYHHLWNSSNKREREVLKERWTRA